MKLSFDKDDRELLQGHSCCWYSGKRTSRQNKHVRIYRHLLSTNIKMWICTFAQHLWCRKRQICLHTSKDLQTNARWASLQRANSVQTVFGSACCTSSSMMAWPYVSTRSLHCPLREEGRYVQTFSTAWITSSCNKIGSIWHQSENNCTNNRIKKNNTHTIVNIVLLFHSINASFHSWSMLIFLIKELTISYLLSSCNNIIPQSTSKLSIKWLQPEGQSTDHWWGVFCFLFNIAQNYFSHWDTEKYIWRIWGEEKTIPNFPSVLVTFILCISLHIAHCTLPLKKWYLHGYVHIQKQKDLIAL